MKCPIDQTEMEKGRLLSNGSAWVSSSSLLFTLNRPVINLGLMRLALAWRCPTCNKLEFTIE